MHVHHPSAARTAGASRPTGVASAGSAIRTAIALSALATLGAPGAAHGQPTPPERLAAQRQAMQPLAMLHGTWRGTAWSLKADGGRHSLVQTERAGPFLEGTVFVIEGKGYDADGSVSFNALGTLSYEPATRQYTLTSHTLGQRGQFAVTLNPDGYSWEVPSGPGATVRYTAVIKDDVWIETGERIAPPRPPLKIFEMTLQRLGSTTWPAGGAVPPR